jgi:EAL domain-containing protein (putative c-di-GMP-specific phosphodiesterase class I)
VAGQIKEAAVAAAAAGGGGMNSGDANGGVVVNIGGLGGGNGVGGGYEGNVPFPPGATAGCFSRYSGRLYVKYQPQIRHDGSIIGAEALLRWDHEQFGQIIPPVLVTIAEESGYIHLLGKFVFASAFAVLRELQLLGLEDFIMSVNITPGQLDNPNLATETAEIARAYGVSPTSIEIEITEQAALGGGPRLKVLDSLHKQGFRLSMDDFGMGHSSLIYLKEFNLNTIKLDGSLSREVESNPTCCEIITSIVQLAKSVELDVIAEFVETEPQKEILWSLGCDHYQGYLYSPALSFNEFVGYCRANGYIKS